MHDIVTYSRKVEKRFAESVTAMAFTDFGEWLAAGTERGSIYLLSGSSYETLHEL